MKTTFYLVATLIEHYEPFINRVKVKYNLSLVCGEVLHTFLYLSPHRLFSGCEITLSVSNSFSPNSNPDSFSRRENPPITGPFNIIPSPAYNFEQIGSSN